MVRIERKTYNVKTRGVGRPDYSPLIAVAKPIVGIMQEKFSLLWTPLAVPPGTVVASDIYNVPTGFQLNIGGAFITCDGSCIQTVRMCHTPGIIGDYRYDMEKSIPFTPLSSTVIPAGDTCTVYVFNNDSVAHDFSVTVTGVLEEIGPS